MNMKNTRNFIALGCLGIILLAGMNTVTACEGLTIGYWKNHTDEWVCYTTDHYFRAYVQIKNGTGRANDSIKNYSTVNSNDFFSPKNENIDIGPLWKGKIQNKKIIMKLRTILFNKKLNTKNELWKLLDLLEEEADGPNFFYETDKLASIFKKSPPKMELLFKKLNEKGYNVYRTHFSLTGFKTNSPKSEIEKVFK